MSSQLATSVLILFLMSYTISGQENNCIYTYYTQPPSEITCNVYDNNDFVALDCSVATFVPTNYTLKWYFEDELITNVTIIPLALETRQPGVPTIYLRSSRLILERTDIQAGEYYCQIQLIGGNSNSTESDNDFPPSNMLYLGTERSLQNATSCNTSIFSIDEANCARTFPFPTPMTATISPKVSDSTVTFPIWGFAVASSGSVIVLVVVLVSLVSVVMYAKKRHQDKLQSVMTTQVYEERSEQNSTSTDHIYEELDIFVSELERRQQHFTATTLESESNSDMEHTQQRNMDSETELGQQQNLESEHTRMEYGQQENLDSEYHKTEQEYFSSDETESDLSLPNQESEISEVYDKLLAIKMPLDIVMRNKDYYDQLDPKLEGNLSYNRRGLLDPQLIKNPSYSHQLEPLTITNMAYNKRDELDPHTAACPAYNTMSPP